MRKLLYCLPAFALLLLFVTFITRTRQSELDIAISRTADYLLRTVSEPQVGSVGGEWTVFGLARSDCSVPDGYFERYFDSVERHVSGRNGVLDERRYTEYSRVVLALTAAGYDPQNAAGYDLTVPLSDFESVVSQGINGAVFALLALDSFDYPAEQGVRELYVNEILRLQTRDGGWALIGETGDADLTGMALQALAKYRENPDVSEAADRALSFLSLLQDENGGFSSVVESAVQVLVALTELGLPIDDPRFVKNGNTLLYNILSFQNADGRFRHTQNSTEENLMSTETAFYGLVAAQRAAEGNNSLYDMRDNIKNSVILSVSVESLLVNMRLLDSNKHELVPFDGMIFPETAVSVYDGESVFDVLNREMRNAGIHLAFRRTPALNSVYIEAINNIYEFDAGVLSGWQYTVNGEPPGIGASLYILRPGDVIEWFYSVDLGRDSGQ